MTPAHEVAGSVCPSFRGSDDRRRRGSASMGNVTARDLRQLFTDIADVGTYGCFEYQGISLGFHSDDAELLDWFSRFFGGYFTVTANELTDAVVYSSQDPAV